jgi:hypothetical protein
MARKISQTSARGNKEVDARRVAMEKGTKTKRMLGEPKSR